MRVSYVMRDIGIGGGSKSVYEQVNGLAERGHECEMVYLTGDANWFYKPIKFNLNKFLREGDLITYLKEAISVKVATWWETASWVAHAGGGLYLVQDIESSYYWDKASKDMVLSSYNLGLRHITINSFQKAVLRYVYNSRVDVVGISIDKDIFKQRDIARVKNTGVYCYRPHYLKAPALMATALVEIKKLIPDFKLSTYSGLDCKFSDDNYIRVEDTEVAELMSRSSVFISTSLHEGFNLPVLEAMACGCPVVTTPSTGNETFCINGVNCLMAEDAIGIAKAVKRLADDSKLAKYLIGNALKTVANYSWSRVVDKVEQILKDEYRILNIKEET